MLVFEFDLLRQVSIMCGTPTWKYNRSNLYLLLYNRVH